MLKWFTFMFRSSFRSLKKPTKNHNSKLLKFVHLNICFANKKNVFVSTIEFSSEKERKRVTEKYPNYFFSMQVNKFPFVFRRTLQILTNPNKCVVSIIAEFSFSNVKLSDFWGFSWILHIHLFYPVFISCIIQVKWNHLSLIINNNLYFFISFIVLALSTAEDSLMDTREGENILLKCRFSEQLESNDFSYYWARISGAKYENVAIGKVPLSSNYR